MARRYSKGYFTPQNSEKYVGDYPIIYRSSWEKEFMQYCDVHPDVLEWASEPEQIPYKKPLRMDAQGRKKQSIYVPDFLVTFLKANGERSTKLIEIKPTTTANEKFANNGNDVAERINNEAKWGAATQWAMRRGIEFIVLTEQELFANHANRMGRAHPVKAVGQAQVKNLTPKAPNRRSASPGRTGLSKATRSTRGKAKASISSRAPNTPKTRKTRKR